LGDQQGTIRDLATTDNGTTSIITHRIYDSYGNLMSSTGSIDCLFGFTGRAWDSASRTWRSNTRPYDPSTGSWTQKDLIGFNGCDTNTYRYCGNSPTNETDPSGEDGKYFTKIDGYDVLFKWAEGSSTPVEIVYDNFSSSAVPGNAGQPWQRVSGWIKKSENGLASIGYLNGGDSCNTINTNHSFSNGRVNFLL
jgi:RHS repeat-associated protein